MEAQAHEKLRLPVIGVLVLIGAQRRPRIRKTALDCGLKEDMLIC